MSGIWKSNQRIGLSGVAVIAILGLAGCDESGQFALPSFGGDTTEQTATGVLSDPGTGTVEERDVEAPDVFSVTDAGLWDGRPSLGGVWVAHPDVTDPERVIIRNTANDQFVIGALFRRERDNPGPVFQVSSDAAETLGLLAGAPTQLSVIALRREEVVTPPPAATVEFDEAPAIAEAPLDATAPVDAVDPVAAIATSAIAAAEAAPAPAPVPASAPASSLDKPFVQIGIFSIEANATRTADRLRGDGLSARIIAGNSQGRNFWRVIVGPAPTEADRAAVIAKVKGLGFADAYAVSN